MSGDLFDFDPPAPPTTEAERRAHELLENEAIFGVPTTRRNDQPTSQAAARRARPHAGNARGKALLALAAAGEDGLTDFELADRTGYVQTSIGMRRLELAGAGLVYNTGRTRDTPRGRAALVWAITPNGKMVAYQLRKEEE